MWACAHTHTHSMSDELPQKLYVLRGWREETLNFEGVGGGWTQVVCDKHTQTQSILNSPSLPHHSHKVHHSPLRDVFISDLWHKSHSSIQAYLVTSLETQRSPQRAPQCSTCHFQLVPQRESSATNMKMGAHYWIPLNTLKYRSGGSFWGLQCATWQPCHTSLE